MTTDEKDQFLPIHLTFYFSKTIELSLGFSCKDSKYFIFLKPCSDVWALGLGGLLWEPFSPLSGLPWPYRGSVLRSCSQSAPYQVHLPGLLETPQVATW